MLRDGGRRWRLRLDSLVGECYIHHECMERVYRRAGWAMLERSLADNGFGSWWKQIEPLADN
jgi:hypothetical protein